MEAEKTFPEHSRIPVPGMSEEAPTGGFGIPLPGSGCIFWDLGCGIPSGIPNLDVYPSHSSDPSGPLGTHPKEFFFPWKCRFFLQLFPLFQAAPIPPQGM